jgi:hypothetical protein
MLFKNNGETAMNEPRCSLALVMLLLPQEIMAQENGIQRVLLQVNANEAQDAYDTALIDNAAFLNATRSSIPNDIQEVALPVLLLGSDEERSASNFHSQVTSYSATYDLPEALLLLTGTMSALEIEGVVPFDGSIFGDQFEQTEDGADYSLVRFGVSYNLRLFCDEPLEDERCMTSAYLENIASRLIVVSPGARQ